MVQLNSRGMIADYAQTTQFEPNETEFACGFFAASLNKYAGLPGKGASGTSEQIDQFADNEYKAVYGSFDASQGGGISIPQLHTVFHDAGNLHYWDIVAIGPSSGQTSDIAAIKAALKAGYPVIATITEASVNDLTGDIPAGNPYEWNPVCNSQSCPTHVITYVGIAADGNLLVVDPANVVGPLQGSNTVRAWPRKYDASSIDNTFATVMQLVGPDASNPWLKPIPSGDPTSWPAGFDAQNFGPTTPLPAPAPSPFEQEAEQVWAAFFKGLNDQLAAALAKAGITQQPVALNAPAINTGIYKSWEAEWHAGRQRGPALTFEYRFNRTDGKPIARQDFPGGSCEWELDTGTPNWY